MRSLRGLTGEMKILVDDKEIKESSIEKLLGVVLNNKLTFMVMKRMRVWFNNFLSE